MERHRHFLLLTFPAQGHINPTLQFAKRLLLTGRVTFATSLSAHRRMQNTSSTPDGLSFATFSDGFDDDSFRPNDANYLSEMERHGSKFVTDLTANLTKEGNPITCIVYTLVLPWAAHVSRKLGLPSAILWIQPATVFYLYYYFHSYEALMTNDHLELIPGLPVLTSQDIPTFFLESKDHTSPALQEFQKLVETLDQETEPWVLVNTFDALEPQGLRAIGKLNLVGIGPLLPSAYLDGNDPSDKSFGADLFHGGSIDYIEWLNSKMDGSVVYVSFGSLAEISKSQMEAIANGLLQSRRPFLWVIRGGSKEISRLEELNGRGLIVPWCSQVEVLSHSSMGCFVTHCGWNSTLEGLVAGVPMVAFPQWSEQPTNAKLIEDVWRTGVRVKVSDEDGERIVKSEEIVRCLEIVMEEESGQEMRENAKRWRILAREAAKEGGSSDRNIRGFLEKIGQ